MSKIVRKIHGNLNIAVCNVHGFSSNKAIDDVFLNTISNLDIFSLVETWSGSDNPEFDIPGFSLVAHSIRKKHKKARRFSGGISVYVKNEIRKGVSQLPFSNSDIVWLKL